jgi:hypothetical protein
MRIGGTDLGGISGGLYAVLEEIGRFVFRVLLGPHRSARISLEYTCVRAGAALIGIPLGSIGGALVAPFNEPSFGFFLGVLLIGGASEGVAEALIGYVQRLRREELDAGPPRDKTKTFE